jgi:hypothetical protein
MREDPDPAIVPAGPPQPASGTNGEPQLSLLEGG